MLFLAAGVAVAEVGRLRMAQLEEVVALVV
jgi:hypothetical protein